MKTVHNKNAIYAITENGTDMAIKLHGKLRNSQLFLPERFKSEQIASYFEPGEFSLVLRDNWKQFDAHIFFMATGIVVRKIATLIEHKTVDPAVVVCDEKGKFAISLLSGHIGGANRLTKEIAAVLNAQSVITTATDVQGLMAFDELAAINGWEIKNPENIKELNSLLLENKPIAVMLPEDIYRQYYAERKEITLIKDVGSLNAEDFAGAVVLGNDRIKPTFPILRLNEI